MIERTLGHYTIDAKLGAGGMGEVYRARDTRLDRVVAIKILPPALASDPQFRERLAREARTLSALNHPHICTLHDIGSDGGVDYLVLEFLEGQTLAERLSKGAKLRVDEALNLAVQIADALAAAHKAGIVHRDLKPANIFLVRRPGKSGAAPHVKLLDFGIAKAAPAIVTAAAPESSASLNVDDAAPQSPTARPTTPASITGHGAILGTFQYMSPEQLEGRDVDARSDIFAFGAVLYEMLTGNKAFTGKSQASLIASILDREPPLVSAVQPLAPPALDHVVQRCLAKDPDDRWQSAADVMREIDWIRTTPAAAVVDTTEATSRARGLTRLWAALALALIAAAAIGAYVAVARSSSPAPGTAPVAARFNVLPPAEYNFATNVNPALSPDGTTLAFVADQGASTSIWVRRLDSLEAAPVTAAGGGGIAGAQNPFWSPDGRSIGFFAGGALRVVERSTGNVRTIVSSSATGDAVVGGGAAWAEDGTIVFVRGGQQPGLAMIPAEGGAVRQLTHAAAGDQHQFPAIVPASRRILFFSQKESAVYTVLLDGGTPARVVAADGQAAFAQGRLLFVQQGALLAQPFDVRSGTLSGGAERIAEQVGQANNGFSLFSVAGSTLAYRSSGPAGSLTQLQWASRDGALHGTIGSGRFRNPTLAPDDSRVAVEAFDPATRTYDVWVLEVARGVASRLTTDPADDVEPIWSADGEWILFRSTREGRSGLYRRRSNGAGVAERIADAPGPLWDRTPDGRDVLLGGATLQLLSLDPPHMLRPFDPGATGRVVAQIAPDGRWVLYDSSESGRFEIYAQAFPNESGGRWQVSTDGGLRARWSRNGREIFYIAPNNELMAVTVTEGQGLTMGTPVRLFNPRTLLGGSGGPGFWRQYDVARDGRFLLNVPLESAGSPLTVLVNWPQSAQSGDTAAR